MVGADRAVLSRFEFCYPRDFRTQHGFPGSHSGTVLHDGGGGDGLEVDEDGDLVVTRRSGARCDGVIIIEHQQSTSLSLVGEQVWRGALFLADFILHSCRGAAPHQGAPDAVDVRGRRVLEVASGVGLTSIVAAMAADSVVITDINRGNILRLIQRNLDHNQALVAGCRVTVEELDFCNLDTLDALINRGCLEGVEVILAADVVYNNDLTDAFFAAVHRLLSAPPCKTLLVALEKRYVFTTTEYDVVAPCYEYFLHRLDALTRDTRPHPGALLRKVTPVSPTSPASTCPEAPASTCPEAPASTCPEAPASTCPESPASTCPEAPASTCPEAPASTCPGSRALHIHATCLDHASFPQYFVYDRTKELVLWTIRATLT